jgi:hypothetical protein
MASKVDIANVALVRASADQIENFEVVEGEDSVESRVVNALWDPLIDEVMQIGCWTFAQATDEPAALATTISEEFDYSYALPSDCLQLLSVLDAAESEYDIEGDYIVTNLDSVKIKYIRRVTDTTKYSAKFASAFAYRLAADIVLTLQGDLQRHQQLYGLYEKEISKAVQMDQAQRRRKNPKKHNKLVNARVSGIRNQFETDDTYWRH